MIQPEILVQELIKLKEEHDQLLKVLKKIKKILVKENLYDQVITKYLKKEKL